MHDYHASGYCGLPGDEEGTGEKCGEAVERFTGNRSLSEGAHLELRIKRYGYLTARDPSIMKIFSTRGLNRQSESVFWGLRLHLR